MICVLVCVFMCVVCVYFLCGGSVSHCPSLSLLFFVHVISIFGVCYC